jgi:glutamate-1-semialdehyde 2,1-aminomutase
MIKSQEQPTVFRGQPGSARSEAIIDDGASSGSPTNLLWHERASRLTPGGVHSNARLVGADVVYTHGIGPWLFDVEGQRHVDYMLGRGPAFLGHTPTAVHEAVALAASKGLTLGSGTTLEIEAATSALESIEWADQIRFVTSGTEAVQTAFRLARAATGRSLIIQFEGQYHGWLDSVSLSPGASPSTSRVISGGQVPTSGAHTLLLPWNDVTALHAAFSNWGDEIAAVITEPVNIFGGVLPTPGYLDQLRSITERSGTALIFDEVVTGFRLRPGTAAPLVGVSPDLATYAKAMGSGWPVAAVAGTAAMFEGVAEDRVRLSGTYNGNSAAMAAVIATLKATADGEVHRLVRQWSERLMDGLLATAAESGVKLRCEGYPSAFWLVFDEMDRAESDATADRLALIMREHRIIQYHHTWLPSAAHDEEALEFTLEQFSKSLAALTRGKPA